MTETQDHQDEKKERKPRKPVAPPAAMSFEVNVTPTLPEGTTAEQVLSAWLDVGLQSDVVTPRGNGVPYRTLRIPDVEFEAVVAAFGQ